ncbi:TetR/AcrR family transcriptional regulator [Mycolicibacterium vaccae]|uniref:TetR/AcrR family transcriptional regulator n=1 Tax=Mycolicibacterium vaccae TaxID=1810 RepID=UPI003CFD5CC5
MVDTADENQVVAAATELFNERGVQSVGMDAIRDAAGIPLKRLYSYFPSKAALISAVLAQRDRDIQRAMIEFVESRAEEPRDRILAVFDYLAHWFTEPDFRGCMFINSVGELGGTSPDVRRIARRNKLALRDYLAGLVAEAGLPAHLADQLAILANGAIVAAALYDDAEQAADAARRAAATLLAA